ncbi:MAG: cell division ATP-binding protein FtsE [Clostridiales bacterium]|nr:cell division ATP-binding protein FtsE [Clostridiales bacterium]
MIRFDDVHKTYRSGVDALRGISFTIEDGEFVFIIGKSGSGKSTLMKCITCEESPSEGEVSIDDFVISSMSRKLVPVLRRQIGMIYQDFRLIETKTVFENIAFAGEIVGIPRKSLNQTVQLVLNIVGLKDKAEAYPQELSGGEQQRVAIARAMVNNPKLIVADEPTGNLDPETSENIMALLLDINNSGTTVVVCTHDSNLVDRMKKRVIEIEAGLIARDEKDSRYRSEGGNNKPVEKPSVQDVGFAFGDDPAFEHDNEYNDSFDDEGFEPAPSIPAFGDEELPAPVTQANPGLMIGDTPAEVALIPEAAEIPEVPANTETSDEDVNEEPEQDIIEELPVEELDSEEIVEQPVEELLFGTEEKAEPSEQEPEAKADDGPEEIKPVEEWVDSINIDESDIDLDISEDD